MGCFNITVTLWPLVVGALAVGAWPFVKTCASRFLPPEQPDSLTLQRLEDRIKTLEIAAAMGGANAKTRLR